MINNVTRKQFNNVSGIYKITNNINGKIYIGRSKNLYCRLRQYFGAFRKQDKSRINEYLLNSMNKYGFENFTFEILEVCENYLTPKKELDYILKLKSNDKDIGYNLRLDTSSGVMLTDKRTSDKISNRLKSEWIKGIRKNHSDKLKKSWKNRSRKEQSELMVKNLTKYKYLINDTREVDHQGLVSLGLANCLSEFHRKRSDFCIWKSFRIQRIRL